MVFTELAIIAENLILWRTPDPKITNLPETMHNVRVAGDHKAAFAATEDLRSVQADHYRCTTGVRLSDRGHSVETCGTINDHRDSGIVPKRIPSYRIERHAKR